MQDDRFYRRFAVYADDADSSRLRLEGRPIVFEKPALIQGRDSRGNLRKFWEIIDKDALKKTDLSDVPLRSEHDHKTIYARTRNGSLILDVKPDGLHMTAFLLDNEKSRTLYEEVRSGLIPQMSFSFPTDSRTVNEGTRQGIPVRRVMEIPRLLDVSTAAYGAYGDQAYVNARSFDWMVCEDEKAKMLDRRIYALKLKIEEALLKGRAMRGE
jgi:HK97 family phage prohead protease